MSNRALIALAFVLLSQAIIAQDLGNYGKVFDVREHDIREVILARLNHLKDDGQLDKLEKEIKKSSSLFNFRYPNSSSSEVLNLPNSIK